MPKVICPHCGTDNSKSLIVTTCVKCMQSLTDAAPDAAPAHTRGESGEPRDTATAPAIRQDRPAAPSAPPIRESRPAAPPPVAPPVIPVAPEPRPTAPPPPPPQTPRPATRRGQYRRAGSGIAPADADRLGAYSLIFGVLGFAICGIFGPLAIYFGSQARREKPDGPGRIGLILGVISTVFLALGILFFGLIFVSASH